MPDQAPSLDDYLASQSAAPPSLEGYLASQEAPKSTAGPVLSGYEKALNTSASDVFPSAGPMATATAGLVQGLLKSADKAVLGTADVINNHFNWGVGKPPLPVPTDEDRKALTVPNQPGQGTGEFLGDAAMFALPAGVAGVALKGAPLAARLIAQAAIGSGVSAAQTGGDPAATITGGLMGAGSEAGGPAAKAIGAAAKDFQPTLENFAKSFQATPTQKGVITEALPTLIKEGVKPTGSIPEMAQAIQDRLRSTPVPPKALTLNNFARSFGATPSQNPVISKSLPTLTRDGISPAETAPEMLNSVRGKLTDLGKQYDAVPKSVADRTIHPDDIIQDLRKQQAKFVGGVEKTSTQVPSSVLGPDGKPQMITKVTSKPMVSSANQGYYDQIGREIDDVKKLATSNPTGLITFKNLQYLRDGANGRTNWASPDADRNLFSDIGNVYRNSMNKIAPETTQLNRDYATYKGLESVAEKNVNTGRGIEAKPDIWEGQEGGPYEHYRNLNDVAQKNLGEGKGTTPNGFDNLLHQAESAGYGMVVGEHLGRATGLPLAGEIGGLAGMYIGPKLAGTVGQALKNVADSGAWSSASPSAKRTLQAAIQTGRTEVIQRAIQGLARKTATATVSGQ